MRSERAEGERLSQGRPVVLVAEDDADHRFVLQRLFSVLRVDVDLRFVTNGIEMLGYLRDCRLRPEGAAGWPRFILLDLHMPQMDGLEALRQMRADHALRSMPAVVFSSSNEPAQIERAYAAGANAYLVKVGDFRRLVSDLRGLAAFWLEAARVPEPRPSLAAAQGPAE